MKLSEKLKVLLKEKKNICVLTGAGVSAESGVKTFRDVDGLWAKLKPEELANFDAFMRNPDLVWEWYSYRRKIVRDVEPNPGHFALVEMERNAAEFTLVTQNVDNLHRRAGSQNVLELHGNLERNYCMDCHRTAHESELQTAGKVPRCPECNGLIRPDVVWFGEMLPENVLKDAQRAAERCDLFIVAGTSAVVFPAAGLPFEAKRKGAYVVEVNMNPTEISSAVDESLIGPAGEILPQLSQYV